MKFPVGSSSSQAGGILTKLLLGLGILFVLGAIAWILWLPTLVVTQIHAKTGFVVKVDQLSVNPFTAKVAIKGLVLKNPAGWPTEDFIDLREFKVEADLFSLFSNRLVVHECVVDIASCTMVKNKQGVLNSTAFGDALKGKSDPGQSKPAEAKKGFMIKHLELKFDRLVYADFSGAKPMSKKYDLNFRREFRDVDSVAKILNPIASDASMGMLTDALNGTFNGRTDLLKDVAGVLKDAGKKTGEKLKGLLDSLDKKKP